MNSADEDGEKKAESTTLPFSDSINSSEELSDLFENSPVQVYIRQIWDQLLDLAYLLTQQQDHYSKKKFVAMSTLFIDASFMMMLCFSSQVHWFQDMRNFQSISDHILFHPEHLEKTTIYPIFTLVWCLVWIIVLVASICLLNLSNQLPPPGSALKMLRNFIFWMITIGYIPILSILLSPLSCEDDGYQITLRGHPDVLCFSNPHISYLFLAAIGSVVFILISWITASIHFDPIPRSNDILSRPTSRLVLLDFATKTLAVIIYMLVGLGSALSTFLLLSSLFVTGVYYLYPFYYDFQTNKLRFSLLMAVTWTALFSAIYSDGAHASSYAAVVVYCLLLPIVCGCGYKAMSHRQQKLLSSFHDQDQHPRARHSFRLYYDVELKTRCILHQDKHLDVASVQRMKDMFQSGIHRFRHSATVYAQMCLYLLSFDQYCESGEMQMHIYTLVGMKKQTIEDKYLAVCARRFWQQRAEAAGGGRKSFELNDQLFYRRQSAIARYYHREAKKKLYFFWHSLLRKGITEAQIDNRAEEFEHYEKRAIASYDHMLHRFPGHKELLRSVGGFWMEIHGDSSLADEYFSIADEIEEAEANKKSRRMQADHGAGVAGNPKDVQSEKRSVNDSASDANEELTPSMRSRKQVFKDGPRTGTTNTSNEQERLRRLRARLNKLQSSGNVKESDAITHFTRLLNTLQFVIFSAPVVGYILFKVYIGYLSTSANILLVTHDQLSVFHDASYTVRSQMLNNLTTPSDSICAWNSTCIKETRHHVIGRLENFLKMTGQLFTSNDLEVGGLHNFWASRRIPVTTFKGNPPQSHQVELTYLSLLSQFALSAKAVLEGDIVRNYETSTDYLFIIKNAPTAIFDSMRHTLDLIVETEHKDVAMFTYEMIGLICAIAFIVMVIAISWQPVYERVRSEVSALRLLRDLTSEGIMEMCAKFPMKGTQSEDADTSSALSLHANTRNQDSMIRQAFTFLTFVAMIMFFVFCILQMHGTIESIPDVDAAALRISYVHLTEYLEREIFLMENPKDVDYTRLEEARNYMMKYHYDLVRLAIGDDSEVDWLLEGCKKLSSQSLQGFMTFILKMSIDDELLSQSLTPSERKDYILRNYGYVMNERAEIQCMLSVRDDLMLRVRHHKHMAERNVNIYFILVWPLFLYFFAYQIPLRFREQIRSAAGRSNKLLRMIPPSVADTAPDLKDYLVDNGIMRVEDFEEFKELGVKMVDMNDEVDEDELISVSRRNSPRLAAYSESKNVDNHTAPAPLSKQSSYQRATSSQRNTRMSESPASSPKPTRASMTKAETGREGSTISPAIHRKDLQDGDVELRSMSGNGSAAEMTISDTLPSQIHQPKIPLQTAEISLRVEPQPHNQARSPRRNSGANDHVPQDQVQIVPPTLDRIEVLNLNSDRASTHQSRLHSPPNLKRDYHE